jgi:alpha-acetolactate decarboxylase
MAKSDSASGLHQTMARRLPLRVGALGALAMLASCSAPPAYQQWGSMREVLRDGNTEARVALSDAGITAETYGVGALAGLQGEITIDAGDVTVSRSTGADAVTTTKGISDDDAASMLFLGTVSGWHNIDITEPVSSLEVDGLLGTAFAGRGTNHGPTPFRIEGTFSDIKLHVIGGQCPIRARMHGEPMTSPAFELDIPQASATVIGIYADDAAGDVTHMGSDTHMHILVEHDGRTITGHVESIGVLPGSTLQIPDSPK